MIKEYLERQFKNYHAITSGYVTPEMFGAKGDGVTDDTEAFTRAFANSKNVKCLPNKRYYFASTVDCSQRGEGTLDINGATLLNFHIKIAITDVYKALVSYPAKAFRIKNGRLGEWNTRPQNWQVPIIISGTKLYLEELYLGNMPYLVALTNSYLDGMVFKNLLLSINKDLWNDTTAFELDAVNILKQDGIFAKINQSDVSTIPTSQQGFADDSWNIEGVNEFAINGHGEYAFCHFFRNTALMINKCIQSHFVVGKYSQATFMACHFEKAESNPEIYNLEDTSTQNTLMNEKVVAFINCYFYDSYKLETNSKGVEYYNCYIRGTSSSPTRDIPLADVFNGVDYYDMKCKLHNCVLGGSIVIDIDTLLSYKRLPKRTRSYRNGTENEQSMASKIALTETLGSGNNIYPEIGTYHYTGYIFATGSNIAHEKYEWDREISSSSVGVDSNGNINGLNGGWRFEVYRTLPSGIIQRARFYADPFDRDSNTTVYFRLKDLGTYLNMLSGYGLGNEINIPLPWIEVESLPTYTINNKVYEKNGVLVTTDNSLIQGIGKTSQYVQVADSFTSNLA